jgi:hypothetical protein
MRRLQRSDWDHGKLMMFQNPEYINDDRLSSILDIAK